MRVEVFTGDVRVRNGVYVAACDYGLFGRRPGRCFQVAQPAQVYDVAAQGEGRHAQVMCGCAQCTSSSSSIYWN